MTLQEIPADEDQLVDWLSAKMESNFGGQSIVAAMDNNDVVVFTADHLDPDAVQELLRSEFKELVEVFSDRTHTWVMNSDQTQAFMAFRMPDQTPAHVMVRTTGIDMPKAVWFHYHVGSDDPHTTFNN